jgi:hypothetical protein
VEAVGSSGHYVDVGLAAAISALDGLGSGGDASAVAGARGRLGVLVNKSLTLLKVSMMDFSPSTKKNNRKEEGDGRFRTLLAPFPTGTDRICVVVWWENARPTSPVR